LRGECIGRIVPSNADQSSTCYGVGPWAGVAVGQAAGDGEEGVGAEGDEVDRVGAGEHGLADAVESGPESSAVAGVANVGTRAGNRVRSQLIQVLLDRDIDRVIIPYPGCINPAILRSVARAAYSRRGLLRGKMHLGTAA
jgi:hypothetical protein